MNEKSTVESELHDLLTQKEDLDVRLRDTEKRMMELQEQLLKEKFDRLHQLLGKYTCCSIYKIIDI